MKWISRVRKALQLLGSAESDHKSPRVRTRSLMASCLIVLSLKLFVKKFTVTGDSGKPIATLLVCRRTGLWSRRRKESRHDKSLRISSYFQFIRFWASLISTFVKRETTSKPKLVSYLLLQSCLHLHHRDCDKCHIIMIYSLFWRTKLPDSRTISLLAGTLATTCQENRT